jgi:hypothetical protein
VTSRVHLVTRRVDPFACRATHPLTREQCIIGPWGHDLHWTRTAGNQWHTDTGKTSSPVGIVYVTYFGRFVPHPGHQADDELEHFPDPIILRNEVACRTHNGYGTSFAPGGLQQSVRYQQVSPDAYMDVWIMVSPDPTVSDPVPDPTTTPPIERWSAPGFQERDSRRAAYLPLVARPVDLRKLLLNATRHRQENRA